MSRSRMLLVSGFLLAIVAGHLVDAWKQRDHWPFAAYPMFARVNTPDAFTSEELWGVTTDGREIPIHSRDLTGVMGINRLRPSLMGLYVRGQRTGDARPAEAALEAFLRDYETRRARGQHSGPELAQLRFYQLKWEFDWWAKNRDAPERIVLFETPPPLRPPRHARPREKVAS